MSGKSKSQVLMPVLLSALAISLTMLFWIVNVVYSVFTPNPENHSEGNFHKIFIVYVFYTQFFLTQ